MQAMIRMAKAGDAAQIAAIYAPVVRETAISFEIEPPDVEEMRDRIAQITGQYPWLVCAAGSEVMGYAYASAHRTRAAYQWAVDTTVYVHPGYRRRGVGRALYTALLGVLPLQGYYNAYAGIALPNPGSVGLHEAVGFAPVGIYRQVGYKLGRWHDVGWWGIALREHADPDGAPLPVTQIEGSPAWNKAIEQGLAQLRKD
jgi:L-amino acid N-acyltransferase YncA